MKPGTDIRGEALRLLASREHSRYELLCKLRTRDFDATEIEHLLDDLTARDLLSEQRMAETYVAERIRKGFGPLRIRQSYVKGLADDLIGPHLERSADEWLAAMCAAHDKRFGHVRAVDARDRARRARFLEYRGFPAELIAGFLRDDNSV